MKKSSPQEIWNTISPLLLKKYKREGTFLDYKNEWQLLVAVILSAQTTDDLVNKITPALFKKFPTIKKMATASPNEVYELVKKVNYGNAKTNYLITTANLILKNFKGKVPLNETDLQMLAGVGRKTAVAVLSNLFDEQVGIAVDTHVIRFATRFQLSSHSDPKKIEQDLLKLIPKQDWKKASYAIKQYGREEGKARGYKKEEDLLWQLLATAKIVLM